MKSIHTLALGLTATGLLAFAVYLHAADDSKMEKTVPQLQSDTRAEGNTAALESPSAPGIVAEPNRASDAGRTSLPSGGEPLHSAQQEPMKGHREHARSGESGFLAGLEESLEPGKVSHHNAAFLRQAAEINLTQIALGKAAQKVSASAEVKAQGERLEKTYGESNRELGTLAAEKGVTVPTEISLWDRHAINSLEKSEGAAFDNDFHTLAIRGQERAIAIYERFIAHSRDAEIKSWAEKTLPSLKSQLALIRSEKGLPAVGEKLKSDTPLRGGQMPVIQHQTLIQREPVSESGSDQQPPETK